MRTPTDTGRVYELAEAELASHEIERTKQLARGAMYNTSSFIARGRFLWQVLSDESPAQANVVVSTQRAGRSSLASLEMRFGCLITAMAGAISEYRYL